MIDKENFERQSKNPLQEERETREAQKIPNLLDDLSRLVEIGEKIGHLNAIIERFGDIMGKKRLRVFDTNIKYLQSEADRIISLIIEMYKDARKP